MVQRSYEDQGYGEGPSHVWVPTAEVMKHTQRDVGRSQSSRKYKDPDADPYYFDMEGMGEADDDELGIGGHAGVGPDADLLAALMKKDMPEDYTNRRNMLMADDTREGDEDIFGDAVEVEDFAPDFIQQMIYGEGGEEDEEDLRLKREAAKEARKKVRGDGDDDEDMEDEEDDAYNFGEDEEGEEEDDFVYPKHDTTGSVLDKQFERMMREFEVDATLNDHENIDPRVQGALQVEQYAPLLEEFADDHARTSYVTDEHLQHRGLINGLRKLTRENRVFDMDEKGMYFTGALPDKATRLRQVFKDEAELNRENTLKIIQRQEDEIIMQMAKGLKAPEEDTRKIVMELPKKRPEHDAETILTTYSTLYNHPNVIGSRKKKLDPAKALRQQQAEMRAKHLQQSQQHKKMEEEAELEAELEDEDDDDAVVLDISERPKDETNEEKKMRRALIKQLQREKRQQKKELGVAYKTASLSQKAKSGEKKQQKAQMTLSMAARV